MRPSILSSFLPEISLEHDSRKVREETSYYNSLCKYSVHKILRYFNWKQILFDVLEEGIRGKNGILYDVKSIYM